MKASSLVQFMLRACSSFLACAGGYPEGATSGVAIPTETPTASLAATAKPIKLDKIKNLSHQIPGGGEIGRSLAQLGE